MKQTIYVSTSSLYWGKANTLQQALKNANYKIGEKVQILVFDCDPKDVKIANMGITRPIGATEIEITGEGAANLLPSNQNPEAIFAMAFNLRTLRLSQEDRDDPEGKFTEAKNLLGKWLELGNDPTNINLYYDTEEFLENHKKAIEEGEIYDLVPCPNGCNIKLVKEGETCQHSAACTE